MGHSSLLEHLFEMPGFFVFFLHNNLTTSSMNRDRGAKLDLKKEINSELVAISDQTEHV